MKNMVDKVLYVAVILLTLYASCVTSTNKYYRVELKKVKAEIIRLEKEYKVLEIRTDTMSSMVGWIQIYTEAQLSRLTPLSQRRNPAGSKRAGARGRELVSRN